MSDDINRNGFSDIQKQILDRVLDDIVPPATDGRLPGAGSLALAAELEAALSSMPAILDMIRDSLTALDALAHRRAGAAFVTLMPPEQQTLINELAASEHAFPPLLLLHTYAAYYRHPHVVGALGMEPRAPHPGGYEMGADDLSLLDPVRQRGSRFRSC